MREKLKLFDAVPVGICVIGGQDLQVKWVNKTYLQFLDEPYQSQGILGCSVEQFIPGAHDIADIIHRSAATLQPYYHEEYELRGFARGITYWKWSLTPVEATAVGTYDIVVMAVDITEQVVARKKLEIEQRRMQALLAALPVGISIADATGRIVQNNECFKQIWGGEAPLSRHVVDYNSYQGWLAYSGEPIAAAEWALAKAINRGEQAKGEIINIKRFDGLQATIINSAAPFYNEAGQLEGAVAVLQDITAKHLISTFAKLALEELPLQLYYEEALAAILSLPILENAYGHISVLEQGELVAKVHKGIKVGQGTSLSVTINKGNQLLGEIVLDYGAKPVQVQELRYFISAFAQILANIIIRHQAEQGLLQHEAQLQALVRERTWELEQEIEERKQAEVQVRNACEESKQVLDTLVDCFVMLDRDWRYVHVSDRAEKFFGRNKYQLEGRNMWEVFPELVNHPIAELFREALLTHKTKYYESPGIVHRDRWYEATINPSGAGLLVCFRDITERKQLQSEMARLDRLNLIGQMASGIAHEIRNPMTSVKGLLQLLLAKEADVKHQEYYELMIAELDRANEIITEFLSLAKNRVVAMKSSSLNDILTNLYPLLHSSAVKEDKRVELVLGDIPELIINEKEIRQLIINLARNGLEAMDSGGLLTNKWPPLPQSKTSMRETSSDSRKEMTSVEAALAKSNQDNTMDILNHQLTNFTAENQYVSFDLDDEEYGIDVLLVQEIIRYQKPTKIPNTNHIIQGVINFRGKVIPLVDLRSKFGLASKEYNGFTVIVILEIKGKTVGITVDMVSDIVSFESHNIQEADDEFMRDLRAEYLKGVGKLGQRLILLLNPDRILDYEEIELIKQV